MHACNYSNISISGLLKREAYKKFWEGKLTTTTTNMNTSENLLVANLQSVSLEKLVRSKLEVLFKTQNEQAVNLDGAGLHRLIMEQVEKPLIELTLQSCSGNQVKAANLLGINRNTLKKKIDNYRIRVRNKKTLN